MTPNPSLTLVAIYEKVSRIENREDAGIVLTLSDDRAEKQGRYALSAEDLYNIDPRLAAGIKAIVQNPLDSPSLKSTLHEYHRAQLLKRSIELWTAGEHNYLIDEANYKAARWFYVAQSHNKSLVTIDWASFTVYREGGVLTVLEIHPNHCEVRSSADMEQYYPGLMQALTIADAMGLSPPDKASFCMCHVNQNPIAVTATLPNTMVV